MVVTSNTDRTEVMKSDYKMLVRKTGGKILDYLGVIGFDWMIILI